MSALAFLRTTFNPNPIERMEAFAEMFRADTGLMAPGKSGAVSVNDTTTHEERAAVYRAWAGRMGELALVALDKLQAAAEGATAFVDGGGGNDCADWRRLERDADDALAACAARARMVRS